MMWKYCMEDEKFNPLLPRQFSRCNYVYIFFSLYSLSDKGKLELPQLLDNSKDDHLIVVQLFCFGTLIFMRIFWFVESDGYADDYLVDFLSTMK
ncbi:uncharacterized protein LOC132045537 isoform X2 [Lycium ferocissimum]|uniref:uncharacterized protein LOC132045537 isoform X2 n=1 Tax=Lycium ferocissimum TaxID=112874 RepID=UPI0028152EFF|nr:uncharacterized protein LOC132045537 isoform X2 [Lycium ferocissimum]